jgi:hypothetical protein
VVEVQVSGWVQEPENPLLEASTGRHPLLKLASFWEVFPRTNDFSAAAKDSDPVPVASPATFMTNTMMTSLRPNETPYVLALELPPTAFNNSQDMTSPPAIDSKALPNVGYFVGPSQTIAFQLPFTCFWPESQPYGPVLANPFCLLRKTIRWKVVAVRKNPSKSPVVFENLALKKSLRCDDPALKVFDRGMGVSLSSERSI